MNKQLKLFTIFTALLTLTILGVGIGYAAPSQDRVVINGEVVRDDLNITDNLIIEAGGLVTEDVNILGGHAYISGTISGDLVVLGGNVELAESAGIGGDCVIIGGNIQRNASPVRCTSIAEGANLPLAAIPSITKDRANLWGGSGATVGNAILTSFLLAIFAFGITAIAPKHIERISDAITLKPVASGTVGILTFLAAISAITLLSLLSALLTFVCIGLLGFPIVLAMG
ncbi:MAG TPA: hypothetical protein ENJ56_02805, partial [Anaerolineae bacterium]|nr:hypothetical protein [Anaerolineae bacterium]